jgi:hypothetical protein
MPLLVPGLVEPQSKKEDDKKDQATQTKPTEQSAAQDSSAQKKVDGRTAPGMQGMSDEAVKKFEEAMELEYQKREGGA